jgi:hypothetical protein
MRRHTLSSVSGGKSRVLRQGFYFCCCLFSESAIEADITESRLSLDEVIASNWLLELVFTLLFEFSFIYGAISRRIILIWQRLPNYPLRFHKYQPDYPN